jgi:hypothetical protein
MNGIECTLEVYSQYAYADDSVGGPEITGVVEATVRGRIEGVHIEMLLLNQGIETGQLWLCTCVPANANVKNNFVVRVIRPRQHFLYNILLKVIGVTRTSGFGSESHLELVLRHVDESH